MIIAQTKMKHLLLFDYIHRFRNTFILFTTFLRIGVLMMVPNTILIVEDEAGIREMTKMYLETKGYKVVLAENGATALKLLN